MSEAQSTKGGNVKVIVTTIHRGVFFGELVEESGDSVKLKNARDCVYWPAETKGFLVYWPAETNGFLGLAANGPPTGSKIGPAAPSITLKGVTSISECTPEAVEKWEAGPWS